LDKLHDTFGIHLMSERLSGDMKRMVLICQVYRSRLLSALFSPHSQLY
jgi:hypothetical protein